MYISSIGVDDNAMKFWIVFTLFYFTVVLSITCSSGRT